MRFIATAFFTLSSLSSDNFSNIWIGQLGFLATADLIWESLSLDKYSNFLALLFKSIAELNFFSWVGTATPSLSGECGL